MTCSVKSATSAPRRKGTLFCDQCGHESLVEGDWTVSETGDRTILSCPECGNVIESRRRFVAQAAC